VDTAEGEHPHLKDGKIVNVTTRAQALKGIPNPVYEFHGADPKAQYSLRVILPAGRTTDEVKCVYGFPNNTRVVQVWLNTPENVLAKVNVRVDGIPEVRTIALPPLKEDSFTIGVSGVKSAGLASDLVVFSDTNKPLGAPELVKTETPKIALDYLLNPANWSQPWTREGNWVPLGRRGDEETSYLFNQGHLQGLDAVYVQVRTKAGFLNRVDIVYTEQSLLDQDQASGDTKHELDKAKLKLWNDLGDTITQKANTDLTHWFGPGQRIVLDCGEPSRREALQYLDKDKRICARFFRLPGLVKLTIEPGWAAANLTTRRAGFPTDRQGIEKAMTATVEHKPTGDVVIPLVASDQIGPYCAQGTLAMIANQMGLELNVFDAVGLSAAYNAIPGMKSDRLRGDSYRAVTEITRSRPRVVYSGGMQAEKLRRLIDRGIPVIVWRFIEQGGRMGIHYKAAHADPLEPPAPLEPLKWPKPPTTRDAADPNKPIVEFHASIVSGYNKTRDEVLVSESWGLDRVNGERMRTDELLATTTNFFWWEP
jgi:hypothetical protein